MDLEWDLKLLLLLCRVVGKVCGFKESIFGCSAKEKKEHNRKSGNGACDILTLERCWLLGFLS